MFEKQGPPQPMTIVSACCVCGNPASVERDGKIYCLACLPAITNLNDSQVSGDVIS